ncbi:MAG: DUF4097 family beta strand repeat-containing protein [Polaribacter sp.]|uniref:DUF4097 family beta strand repeat-containing protein n=1 Tax=Polaribacter sp. TaxID=1920175 RepID=UPI002F34F603
MKSLFLFIGLLLSFNNLTAQKKVTKNTDSKNIEDVYIHLKFAQNIIVKNWNKSEISVEATVNLNDNKENEQFSLKSDKINGTYKITSDYGDLFKKHKNNVTITHNGEGCNSYNNCSNHNNVVVNYVVYVPKNMELKIKSISGNVEAERYVGQLNLDLISGNITIKKHSKDMRLKTISGDIDIYVTDAKFEAKTLTGSLYSDLDIDFDKKRKSGYGSRIKATINKGTAYLKLNTISGDIFLRKI